MTKYKFKVELIVIEKIFLNSFLINLWNIEMWIIFTTTRNHNKSLFYFLPVLFE